MPSVGERDAILMRGRLELEDLGFEVQVADPSYDLAEQIGGLLEDYRGKTDAVLLYASALLAVADEDECFLCLDPDDPDIGDSLKDLAFELSAHGAPTTLIILEGRFASERDVDDHDMAQYVISSIADSVDAEQTGIEVTAGVRPLDAQDERIPSRMTAGLLETIDSSAAPLSMDRAFATMRGLTDFGPWAHGLLHVAGAEKFILRYDDEQRSRMDRGEESGKPAAKPAAADRFPDRRPAPPSERIEVASIGAHERIAVLPTRDPTTLPKVMLSP
ncbi:MAG: hypothetical protein JRI23_04635, partial [Deltaproteobacteria bacterium]|nr:hypothetical protein [Deltaproteobacteria bacterium]